LVVELSLLDRTNRYRRLALLFAEDEPTKRVRPNARIGEARKNSEEAVNDRVKAQAAD
jgi:hypothetical protein